MIIQQSNEEGVSIPPSFECAKLPPIVKQSHIRQFYHWLTDPFRFFREQEKRYGEVFQKYQIGLGPVVMFSNPTAVREIFLGSHEIFQTGQFSTILEPFLGKQSLLLKDGKEHQEKRRKIAPAFQKKHLFSFVENIVKNTEMTCQELPTNQPIQILPLVQEITCRVILENVFGLTEGRLYEEFLGLIVQWFRYISGWSIMMTPLQIDWGSWSSWGKFKRIAKRVDSLLDELVQEAKQNDRERKDILFHLVHNRKEIQLTDEELKHQMLTAMVAGYETTAGALTWALSWLGKEQDVQDRLFHECAPFADDLPALVRQPYLEAFTKEVLRIHPPIQGAGRFLQKDQVISGYLVKKGSVASAMSHLTHWREELYPEPGKFRPERFLEREYTPYEYYPFGGGAKRCIGMHLALYEISAVVACFVQNFRIDYASKKPLHPVRNGLFILPPDKGTLTFQRRS